MSLYGHWAEAYFLRSSVNSARSCALAGLNVILAVSGTRGATTWYVDDNVCPTVGLGTAESPFCRIQDAIDASMDGDNVLVLPGTYRRSLDFRGHNVQVKSVGGAAKTFIADTLTAPGVRFVSGESGGAALIGFNISGGGSFGGIVCAGSSPTIDECIIAGYIADTGGGIDCFDASPTIRNCTIDCNRARLTGAGINCAGGSSPLIEGCRITRNSALLSGGGIACHAGSSPRIVDCTVLDNDTDGSAGGIACGMGAAPLIKRCIIIANWAKAGAGIDCYMSSPMILDSAIIGNVADEIAGGINCKMFASPTIRGCHIEQNLAGLNGGGIICNTFGNATIVACTIRGNFAINGAGLYLLNQTAPSFYRCVIEGNIASGFGGGAVCGFESMASFQWCTICENQAAAGAGIGCGEAGLTDISHCIIEKNIATEVGGGVLANNCSPALLNCLIANNEAKFSGGGIYNYAHGSPSVSRSTVVNNTAESGAQIYAGNDSHPSLGSSIVWGSTRPVVQPDASSTVTATYCTILGGWHGLGNLSANPLLRGAEDYRLTFRSPCRNSGEPGIPSEVGEQDLDGHERVLCGRTDMGAYEFGIGDDNCNGVIDLMDFRDFPFCMTVPVVHGTGCSVFNWTFSGDVDLSDFAEFANAFGSP